MNTSEVATTLATLFGELVEGTAPSGGFMLNPGDRGLLRTLAYHLGAIRQIDMSLRGPAEGS